MTSTHTLTRLAALEVEGAELRTQRAQLLADAAATKVAWREAARVSDREAAFDAVDRQAEISTELSRVLRRLTQISAAISALTPIDEVRR
jgi:hypothetical protein